MVLLSWENRRRSTGADRRRQRAMMRGYCRPWTGRMALVVAVLMACVALWLVAPPALADAQYTVTVSDWCNIREKPDKDSKDAGDLYAGDIVTGTGYQDGWVQVDASVEAGTGWVRADLLTLTDDLYAIGDYKNTSGGRVRVRDEPDGKTVGWVKAGGTVHAQRWVSVEGTPWAYVGNGYINGTLISQK